MTGSFREHCGGQSRNLGSGVTTTSHFVPFDKSDSYVYILSINKKKIFQYVLVSAMVPVVSDTVCGINRKGFCVAGVRIVFMLGTADEMVLLISSVRCPQHALGTFASELKQLG